MVGYLCSGYGIYCIIDSLRQICNKTIRKQIVRKIKITKKQLNKPTMETNTSTDFYKSNVLGQRSGLFVLFFTEMWERFSFYGMRVLLIQFLTAAVLTGSAKSGWGWTAEEAGALYGTYAMMLYLTPIFGGIIADKYI